MVRFNFLIDEGMLEHLKSLPGTVTEHIRQAIYDYLQKMHVINSASSESVKDGDKNG